ncbi:hypothetical protein FNV43_RR11686 [Rhamnella rubrinervis]|uniref:Uncharacterized protein n=1 Tax=Rhamnella rubrinervis TaxID=2594499 RepID=A0A8K0H5Z5_9ROSA|nr:hypothetical protein FNV43_RR11686 [Rhamnella rubrinervis]
MLSPLQKPIPAFCFVATKCSAMKKSSNVVEKKFLGTRLRASKSERLHLLRYDGPGGSLDAEEQVGNYECKGRTTVTQMLQSPKSVDVTKNCRVPPSKESTCRKCLNVGIIYIHHLVGATSAVDIASCFFGVQGLTIPLVTVVVVIMLLVLVVLIHRKSRELEDCENIDETSSKTFPPPTKISGRFLMYEYLPNGSLRDHLHSLMTLVIKEIVVFDSHSCCTYRHTRNKVYDNASQRIISES